MDKLNWNDIHYFVCLVNQQTLTATAEILDVQHTTVARRIEHLETCLGVKLFDRLGKRYHLTAEGEVLFAQASEIQAHIHTFNRMAINQNSLQGKVVVSAPPVLANEIILPNLSAFYQQYPQINLSIQGDIHRINLHQKDADIALRIGRPVEESLVIRKLRNIDYQLYGSRRYLESCHLEFGSTRVNLSDFNKTPKPSLQLVEFQGSQRIFSWTSRLKQIYDMQAVFNSNDLYLCNNAILQGVGVGILPDFLAKKSTNMVALSELNTSIGIPSELCAVNSAELYLVMHPDVKRSARVRAVADWLIEVLTDVVH